MGNAPPNTRQNYLPHLLILFVGFLLFFTSGVRAAENQPPTANAVSVTTSEDTKLAIKLTGKDPEKQPLTYAIITQPSHGKVVLKGNVATYTPTANYNSKDTFTFTVKDGVLTSPAATVDITVTPVNDAPIAQAVTTIAVKDTAQDIALVGTDVDGDTLTYVPAKKSSKGGSLTLKGGNVVTYTPKKGFVGADSFTFTVTDSKKAKSKIAEVVVTVNNAKVISLKPIPEIPSNGSVGILASNTAVTTNLSTDQRTYLEFLINKANNQKLIAGGQVHWDRLGKTEADEISRKTREIFGNNSLSKEVSNEMHQWVIEYQEEITKKFKEANPRPWLTVKGWKAAADALVNSLKAGVGAAKIAYSTSPITASLGWSKKLNDLELAQIKEKLDRVKLAANTLECTELVSALGVQENMLDAMDLLTKGGLCVSSLAKADSFHKFFENQSSINNIANGQAALGIIDFMNFVTGLFPESSPTTAFSGLLDILSAAISSQIIAEEYNQESLKDMLIAQSDAEKEIDRVLNNQFAWYTKRFINARLATFLVIKYVDGDFSFSPDIPTNGVNVTFEARATSTKGIITSYKWDFGDGSIVVSEGFTMKPSVSHTYKNAGDYRVKLTVTSGFVELQTTVQKTIKIGEAIDENPKDGIPDWWETKYGVTDANADDDGDGLKNIDEYKAGTIPKGEGAQDSDGDGFTDKQEVNAGSDPLDKTQFPLVAPANVKATPSDAKVTVSWDAVQGATSYSICYAPETIIDPDKCISTSQNAVSLPNQTSPAKIPNLINGTTYHFIVAAEDANGKVAHSTEATATPTKPVGATGKLNDTGITTCSNGSQNGQPCPLLDYPGQDGDSGRDVTANDDSDGHAGFSFTKISSTGAELPASATEWSCVKDNVTGLMWEVKTDDGGLHDKDWTYTWYEPDGTKNGGNAGTQNGGSCGGTSQCDTYGFVQAVNAAGWCGAGDWRMPTRHELQSIVSNDRYYSPTIDTTWFPNSLTAGYWSSSPVAYSGVYAWNSFFYFGFDAWSSKSDGGGVRLVINRR